MSTAERVFSIKTLANLERLADAHDPLIEKVIADERLKDELWAVPSIRAEFTDRENFDAWLRSLSATRGRHHSD